MGLARLSLALDEAQPPYRPAIEEALKSPAWILFSFNSMHRVGGRRAKIAFVDGPAHFGVLVGTPLFDLPIFVQMRSGPNGVSGDHALGEAIASTAEPVSVVTS